MAGLGGDVFAGKLPAVGHGRGQAKAGFIAVEQVKRAFLFKFLHLAHLFGFEGVFVRVLGLFQAVAEVPPLLSTLFKKRFSVSGEDSLRNSWRSTAVREHQKVWGSRGHHALDHCIHNPCRHPLNPAAPHFLMLSKTCFRISRNEKKNVMLSLSKHLYRASNPTGTTKR